jgi:hypothetical protein
MLREADMATRRVILATGAASVALIGFGGYRLLHSDLAKARAPWRQAGESFGDPRLDALAYAVLAPNPHNRQPWLVRLDGDDSLTLFCDKDRLLPETDPPGRQIFIGLGAFLELLRQAAAAKGFRLETVPFPEGEPWPVPDSRPVASVTFFADEAVEKDPLFGAALARRTVRVPFDRKSIPDANAMNNLGGVLRAGEGSFHWTAGGEQAAAIKDICKRAWRIEAETQHTFHETVELTRIGDDAINENPDGIALSGPMMEAMHAAGVLTAEKMDEPESMARKESIRFYEDLIEEADVFGWLTTEGNSRTGQLAAGAGWVRLHLGATIAGIAMHPLSQALQEFPEMAGPLREIHEATGAAPPADDRAGRIQGVFRFGYAKFPPPAPRWPLTSRIVTDGQA